MTDYFKEGYQERCDEVNKLEGEINIKITQLKTIGKSGSTISVEKEIEKLLSEYNSKLNTFIEKYKNPPNEIPLSVINKRKNVIESFSLNYDRLYKKYNEAKKEKYAANLQPEGMSEETRNQIKFMDNQQLYEHGQNMLKGQDEKIEEITKDVEQGKKKAKEIYHDVENQIVKLDSLHNNVKFIFLKFFRWIG